ncbi:MAG TPA: hypothetical protein VEC15_02825 [Actinomycetota bacterium]|nr:hypothetical protein [Actinomycetota bacterium]
MRRVLGLAMVAVLAALSACTDGTPPTPGRTASPSSVPPERQPQSPAADGPDSAAAALERLCTLEPPKGDGDGSEVPPEGPTPPAIEQVMEELEQVRGFGFSARVVAEPKTQQEIARGFQRALDAAFPVEFSERRSQVWRTIGVIPDGTDIREELAEYGGSQVIGYYDTLTGELVFLGGEEPTPLESVTLAHELTHAIEDQRFGLERLDTLSARCRDDRTEGALALVEGSATFFMYEWARTFLTPEEQVALVQESASQELPDADVAPFIEALKIWPYLAGHRFVTELEQRGGLDAIDAAFSDLPVSSEQIIHPERYPNDVPTPLDVADLARELGGDWEDLDVMEVGEVWLDTALSLRLDAGLAEDASAGWDGGLYRAWSDDHGRVAIVLVTAWDSEGDAEEFARALQRWIGDGAGDVLSPEGTTVRAIFASDEETLAVLNDAAA